jgi:hypothetical protein
MLPLLPHRDIHSWNTVDITNSILELMFQIFKKKIEGFK